MTPQTKRATPRAPRILAAVCTGALLGVGANAALASAAEIRVTTPCVVSVDKRIDPAMKIVGTGFTPIALVTLSTTTTSEPTPKPLGSALASAFGSVTTETSAASFDSDKTQDQQFTLIATDGLVRASTTFRQVRLGYSRRPATSPASKRVKHIARGFTPGHTVWAHFRHMRKTRATKRLGVARGPCGIAKRRMRTLPAKPRTGTWKVVVDERKAFDLSSRPQVRLTFDILPTFM